MRVENPVFSFYGDVNGSYASKSNLRNQMRTLLGLLKPDDIARLSVEICRHIAREILLLGEIRSIAVYSARGPEVSLASLHNLIPGIKLLYPLCHTQRQLSFHHVSDSSGLVPGILGILEPVAGQHPEVPITDTELVLCPGLAFGKDGTRLGHGGGYYDRILQKHTGLVWGIALQDQLLPHVPSENHDISVGCVITECGFTLAKPA